MGDKHIRVRFGTGQELLNAYWGYLSDGGLRIPETTGLDEGQAVALDIHIESQGAHYNLRGRVVRRQPDDGETVVAFAPGEPHDMLLSAALSETDNTPPRRHRRYATDVPALARVNGHSAQVRLVNLSESGCCMRLAPSERHLFPTGTTNVDVSAGELRATARVVWAHNADRGLQFEPGCDVAAQIRALLDRRR